MTNPGKGKHRGSSRSVLVVIATLLLVSGIIRIGEGIGRAVAVEVAPETGGASFGEPGDCNFEDGVSEVMASLKERELRVTARETNVANRMKALSAAEDQIAQNLAALVAAEDELARTMALAKQAAEGDLAKLTTVYENMKPKDAAALFEEMAPEFAAGFLGRMRADAAAAIMAGMPPQAAYTVSVVLAGRNAKVPTE